MADLDVDRAGTQVNIAGADTTQANGTALLTYTVPAGKKARLKQATAIEETGAASVRLEFVPSGGSAVDLIRALTAASQAGESSRLTISRLALAMSSVGLSTRPR